jgi:hypothetical protein
VDLVSVLLEYREKQQVKDDWEALHNCNLSDKIKNVGPATIQYVRMLSGKDTAKADVHVINAMNHIGVGTHLGVIELLSRLTGYSPLELDQIFWHWDKLSEKKNQGI